MHTDMRIRLCAPQGLSLYSISKRRLNPPLVPVCVLSMRAPNGPEGAATQPKMSIIYRVCELDLISQPNTSYFRTQYLSSLPRLCGWRKAEGHLSSSDGFTRHHVLTRLLREMPGLSIVTLPLSLPISKWGTLEKCNLEQASKGPLPMCHW